MHQNGYLPGRGAASFAVWQQWEDAKRRVPDDRDGALQHFFKTLYEALATKSTLYAALEGGALGLVGGFFSEVSELDVKQQENAVNSFATAMNLSLLIPPIYPRYIP